MVNRLGVMQKPCDCPNYIQDIGPRLVCDPHQNLTSLRNGTGTVRYGTIRYGTVRYGTVRYGTVRYGTVRYGTIRYGTARCGAVRYGTVRYGTVRYGSFQFGSIRFDYNQFVRFVVNLDRFGIRLHVIFLTVLVLVMLGRLAYAGL